MDTHKTRASSQDQTVRELTCHGRDKSPLHITLGRVRWSCQECKHVGAIGQAWAGAPVMSAGCWSCSWCVFQEASGSLPIHFSEELSVHVQAPSSMSTNVWIARGTGSYEISDLVGIVHLTTVGVMPCVKHLGAINAGMCGGSIQVWFTTRCATASCSPLLFSQSRCQSSVNPLPVFPLPLHRTLVGPSLGALAGHPITSQDLHHQCWHGGA